jgi:cytochrome c5
MSRCSAVILVMLVLAAAPAAQTPAPAPNPQQAAVEQGKLAFGQACMACHSFNQLGLHRKTADQWRDTVYSMIGRGAQVFPAEIEPLTAYLTSVFGADVPRTTAGRSQTPALPEGEASTLLTQRCTRCHNQQVATGPAGRSEQEWRQVITRMADVYGAAVTQAERDTLVKYLAALKR